MWKKHKSVVLPTENKSYISRGRIIENFFYCPDFKKYSDEGEVYQYLYILSDDKPKEEDWFINSINNLPCRLNKGTVTSDNNIIITDKSLNLPLISDEFLQQWINNPVDEIEVEYKSTLHDGEKVDNSYPENFPLEVLKLTNNTINCRFIQSKETWDSLYAKSNAENTFEFLEWLKKEKYQVPKQIK